MFITDQKVKRIVGSESCFPSVGSYAYVEKVLDDDLMTLQGCGDAKFLQSHFKAEGECPISNPQVTAVIQALETINSWNKTCPSAQLISIEGHEAVNGGSVFMLGGHFDTNTPHELYDQMVHEVSKSEFQAQLSQLNMLAGKVL